LITKNQPEKAYKILENVAKANRTQLNRDLWNSFLNEVTALNKRTIFVIYY
jgi:hypothetical protein